MRFCYKSDGTLATDGLAAGTPDRGAVSFWNLALIHYWNDVWSFNLAKRLDGRTTGSHVGQYMEVRPPSQGGGKCDE